MAPIASSSWAAWFRLTNSERKAARGIYAPEPLVQENSTV